MISAPPTWSTPREAARVWFARATLRRTLPIAAVVGTILSAINQGSVIAGGNATTATWVRVGANYLVPFCVSSTGYLAATRSRL
jgi:hypothetical protein